MTPKQKEAHKFNWGLMILTAFRAQLYNYYKQTNIDFWYLEEAIDEAIKKLNQLRKRKHEGDKE